MNVLGWFRDDKTNDILGFVLILCVLCIIILMFIVFDYYESAKILDEISKVERTQREYFIQISDEIKGLKKELKKANTKKNS